MSRSRRDFVGRNRIRSWHVRSMAANDYRQMLESARSQGARGQHWPDLDAILKRDLMSLLDERKRLLEGVPAYPGACVPSVLQRGLDEVSREIERLNTVRGEVAAEMEMKDSGDGIWGF